jgi:hypothetical protein
MNSQEISIHPTKYILHSHLKPLCFVEKGHERRQAEDGALDAGLETIGADRIGVLPCASVEQGSFLLLAQ